MYLKLVCYVLLARVTLPSPGAEHSGSKTHTLKLLMGVQITTAKNRRIFWSKQLVSPAGVPGCVIKPGIAENWKSCEAFYHHKLYNKYFR